MSSAVADERRQIGVHWVGAADVGYASDIGTRSNKSSCQGWAIKRKSGHYLITSAGASTVEVRVETTSTAQGAVAPRRETRYSAEISHGRRA